MIETALPYLPGLFLVYTAFTLSVLSPGPNILALIGTSLESGRTKGMALAFGIALGTLTWASLTVFGLSALLYAYAELLIIIKIAGGLYLLWLGYKSVQSAMTKQDMEVKTTSNEGASLAGYMARGYIVQMTNPKAALAWIAIVSLGLQADSPSGVRIAVIIGTFILSIFIHQLIALIFSGAMMFSVYVKARRII